MAFKIAIDNKVLVEVKGSFKGATRDAKKGYDFELTMRRLDQDEINRRSTSSETIAAFLEDVTEGWARQRIVLNEDDTPADFSPEAFKEMLRQPGMAPAIYQAYMAQVGAQAKN